MTGRDRHPIEAMLVQVPKRPQRVLWGTTLSKALGLEEGMSLRNKTKQEFKDCMIRVAGKQGWSIPPEVPKSKW